MARWWLAGALVGMAALAAAVVIRTRGSHGTRLVYSCHDCARAAPIAVARLGALDLSASASERGSQLVVEIRDRIDRERLARVEDVLARRAKVEVKLVEDGSAYMKEIEAVLRAQPVASVTASHEDWRAPTGSEHHDVFLHAQQRDQITQYLDTIAGSAALHLPLDREIGFGRDGDGWRTYLLLRAVQLDGSGISTVEATPHGVRLGLAPRATRQFGTLTSEHLGRKLAIEIDGVVYSAPVVTAPIMNGNVDIDVDDPSERFELAITLRSGASPPLELETVETF